MFQRIRDDHGIDFPDDVPLSDECKDFISSLLCKNPEDRLGDKGPVEVIKHEFFADIDFSALEHKEIDSPIKPDLSDDLFDLTYFDPELTQVTEAQDRRISVKQSDLFKFRASVFNRF